MRVVVGLSGGVDSAVSAARLRDEGHEVLGVHLSLARAAVRDDGTRAPDVDDVARVAEAVGVPFEVWDLREEFDREVVAPFVAEYLAGRTPNPCVRCNEQIKFATLIDRAVARGFDAVGSGHYARLIPSTGPSATGQIGLHRGVDPGKDQAYVLAVLGSDALARCRFPLGDSTKVAVRAEAKARGLPVAGKRDSLDVCFIPDGNTRAFLATAAGATTPGQILDVDGAVVGQHPGALGFTVGQRRGLALRRPAADGRPRYVVSVRPKENVVVVGPAEALLVHRLTGSRVRWCGPAAHVGDVVGVQVRAHGAELPAEVVRVPDPRGPSPDAPLEVALERPARGVACGQTMVLYDGTRVVGSAVIDAAS